VLPVYRSALGGGLRSCESRHGQSIRGHPAGAGPGRHPRASMFWSIVWLMSIVQCN